MKLIDELSLILKIVYFLLKNRVKYKIMHQYVCSS